MNADDEAFFRAYPFLDRLRRNLSTLSTVQQGAFALYCCERLYPLYIELAERIGSSDAGCLRALLDELWQNLGAGGMTEDQIERGQDRLQQIALGDEACCEEQDAGIDAVGAVSLTLDLWRHDAAATAARVAGTVLNRVYQRLWDEAGGSSHSVTADETAAIHRRIEQDPTTKSAQDRLLQIVGVLKQQQSLTDVEIQQMRSLALADA
jgi:uncharacterized protein YjaG (DUF416 family)